MIQAASKYSDVRSVSRQPGRAAGSPPPAGRAHASSARVGSPNPPGPNIIIPKQHGQPMPEWFMRELKQGGFLQSYLAEERRAVDRRWRRVRQGMDGFRQNNKSDWRLLAAVPGRDYARWKQVDPDFWRDDANLRSLRRDNPDMAIYV